MIFDNCYNHVCLLAVFFCTCFSGPFMCFLALVDKCLCIWFIFLCHANKSGAHSYPSCPDGWVVRKLKIKKFNVSLSLCFCAGGHTYSQNGGEDVTSRQHDRGWRHGPPRTPVWRLVHREPEEPFWPQWDLRKSTIDLIQFAWTQCNNLVLC